MKLDALERFLAALPPDARRQALDTFVSPSPPGGEARGFPGIRVSGDPTLERLLDAVWELPAGFERQPQERYADAVAAIHGPVVLVLVPQLQDDRAVAAIVRRAEPEPREIILLSERTASGRALAAALRHLMRKRLTGASAPEEKELIYDTEERSLDMLAPPFRQAAMQEYRELDERIRALRLTERQEIAGLGSVHASIYSA